MAMITTSQAGSFLEIRCTAAEYIFILKKMGGQSWNISKTSVRTSSSDFRRIIIAKVKSCKGGCYENMMHFLYVDIIFLSIEHRKMLAMDNVFFCFVLSIEKFCWADSVL